ncbi:stage II sporulation protein M [Archaeoglobus veneficus]|uniref:Stage II sporulation protein M n=1 Tax=Archaeoglobus veneficus (strain DSM 11195 / SNP6) TaxID=693661 RepID=F2KRQ2_ARCVS|nr:stage II sporulation protein M [Archaeoglobus veneficus]AEA47916.1 protein of unknown function DUF95 transmembrane [Archaeoglobus veneficus SNP6]
MIFLKNNLRLICLIVTGGFVFGFLTFLNLYINGMYLGTMVNSAVDKIGLKTIYLILPHGIFEIPAIIIAGAAGFKIPYEIIRYLAGKKEKILTKQDIKEYLIFSFNLHRINNHSSMD